MVKYRKHKLRRIIMKKKTLRTISFTVVLSLLVSLFLLTVFAGDTESIDKIYSSQELESIYGNEELSAPSAVNISSISAVEKADIFV